MGRGPRTGCASLEKATAQPLAALPARLGTVGPICRATSPVAPRGDAQRQRRSLQLDATLPRGVGQKKELHALRARQSLREPSPHQLCRCEREAQQGEPRCEAPEHFPANRATSEVAWHRSKIEPHFPHSGPVGNVNQGRQYRPVDHREAAQRSEHPRCDSRGLREIGLRAQVHVGRDAWRKGSEHRPS